MEQHDIVIYSFYIAKDLVKEGFALTNMNLNKKIKGKIVFYFEDSDKIREYLSEYHNIKIGEI